MMLPFCRRTRSNRWAANRGALPVAIFALVALGLLAGCEPASRPRARRNQDQATAADQDHLALALEALRQFHAAKSSENIAALQEESQRQLLYHLNRWIAAQPAADGAPRDPLVDQLPRRYRELPEVTAWDQAVFVPADARYLPEAYLLRAISRQVSEDAAQRWLAKQRSASAAARYGDSALDSPEYRLEVARSAFDWTVRHIQLDPLLPAPPAAAADRPSPPEQAIPGPGYRYDPDEIVRFGHGDAWQRARVFLLLARQLELDAVMLAVDDRGPGSRPNLWCPAVLIEGNLYLFDTALGLPVPGAAKGTIATLAEVRANSDLLRRLDERDDGQLLTYPVSAGQLQRVAALVDASSEAVSRRMQLLEARLTGENALILTVSPTDIAKKLHAVPGLENVAVRLWTLPYETRMYHDATERLARRDPEIQRRRIEERGLFLPSVEQGRRLHLLGQLEANDERQGALAEYLRSRVNDEAIAEIEKSERARERFGLPPLPPDLTPQQRQFLLAAEAAQLRLNKQHAGYWIGLAQYDLGQYEAAINWLKDRTLEVYPNGVWTAGARYNLGRTYEALGRVEEARKLYFQSTSPQRHGDLLRARLLREG